MYPGGKSADRGGVQVDLRGTVFNRNDIERGRSLSGRAGIYVRG